MPKRIELSALPVLVRPRAAAVPISQANLHALKQRHPILRVEHPQREPPAALARQRTSTESALGRQLPEKRRRGELGETIMWFSCLCLVAGSNQAVPASHSRSFDHRRLDPLFLTAMAIAFR